MILNKAKCYPKRLIRDEWKIGSGCLLLHPFPRHSGIAQELTVSEAGGEFQGYIVLRLPLL